MSGCRGERPGSAPGGLRPLWCVRLLRERAPKRSSAVRRVLRAYQSATAAPCIPAGWGIWDPKTAGKGPPNGGAPNGGRDQARGTVFQNSRPASARCCSGRTSSRSSSARPSVPRCVAVADQHRGARLFRGQRGSAHGLDARPSAPGAGAALAQASALVELGLPPAARFGAFGVALAMAAAAVPASGLLAQIALFLVFLAGYALALRTTRLVTGQELSALRRALRSTPSSA